MNKTKLASLLTGVGLLLAQTQSFAGAAWTPAAGNQYVQGEILVKFKPGVAAAVRTQIAHNYGAQAVQLLANQPSMVLAKLTPGQSVEQAVSAYANDPNVEYAQPNYIYHTLATPGPTPDPQYGKLWAAKNTGQTVSPSSYGIHNPGTAGSDMNLEPAWNVQTDCSSVVVAVVDTGINYNSTDLAANMWTSAVDTKHGQNFADDAVKGLNSDPMDRNGHGTHVAGIIGAVGGNGIGGAGVCWKASLMAVRVMDATGAGTTITISQGVDYAVANGAKVINMSLGGAGFDPTFSAAITNAQANNVLVVVAAGNETNNNDGVTHSYPCNFSQTNVICVAALDQSYALANFSNWGTTSVDVGAPGTNIYSTWAGTNAVISDFPNGGSAPTGWTLTSTTTASGGGWGAVTGGWLIDPVDPVTGGWGTAKYKAGTDDRAYKTFNLLGVDVAILDVNVDINVQKGDYFNFNYMNVTGDPFAGGGVNAFAITGVASAKTYPLLEADISPCISVVGCTVGFQLTSTATSTGHIGSAMTNLSISTLTLNATSYNTIDGTSMATPEVAGVAALVWAHNPAYKYDDVVRAIKNGGRSVTALSGKTTTGKAVDAMGAISYINPPAGIAVTVQ